MFVGVDVDVIENCTAALSSLAAACDDNCTRISEAGGIEVLVALTTCTCSTVTQYAYNVTGGKWAAALPKSVMIIGDAQHSL